MNTSTLIRLVTLLTLSCPLSPAQGMDAKWQKVLDIPRQSQVRLQTFDRQELQGTLLSVDETTIRVTQKGQQVSKLRQELARVEVLNPSRRARNIAIGAAVGFAVGVVAAFASCPSCKGEQSSDDFNTRLALGGLVGAGAGAGIGAWGYAYKTVYKAKKP